MKRRPFYFSLFLLAAVLPYVAIDVFPTGPLHLASVSLAIGLLGWGLILMYLRKTGKSQWDGPRWRKQFRASPRFKRVLTVVPALCAAWIPILFLLNRRWGLSDGQLGFACGVPLGISLAALVIIKSKSGSCCGPIETAPTQQGGTE